VTEALPIMVSGSEPPMVDAPAGPTASLPASFDPGWAAAMTPVADRIAAAGDFLRSELAAGRRYLPPGPAVLRAFGQPLADVRVLIVGQDPYPTPGHAVGLSFAVAPTVRPLPRSLANIFREYSADLGFPTPATGDLTAWTEQGVLLLNRVLTVAPGAPASHRGKGWEQVTEQAVRALVSRPTPLVAILWGKDAGTLAPLIEGGASPTAILKSAHPSPMSADRGFFGSRPFSRANEALRALGAPEVDWRLP
jgi:uracil-DNA glycosylase